MDKIKNCWLFNELRYELQNLVADMAIATIRMVCKMKDQGLAYELHCLADEYARTPSGDWRKEW